MQFLPYLGECLYSSLSPPHALNSSRRHRKLMLNRRKRETARDVKNLNKKKVRLMKRARELSSDDLVELFHMKAKAKAKAKAQA